MMRKIACLLLFAFICAVLYAEPARSLDDIFPDLTENQKNTVLNNGVWKHSFEKGSSPLLKPSADLGLDVAGAVLGKDPSHIVEALLVVPYNERELTILDTYNAVSKIQNIKDYKYYSVRQNKEFDIYTEATRLESAKKKTPIPDPPSAEEMPSSETMYMRFEDAKYGTLFLRGEVTTDTNGMSYSLTNFEAVKFLFFTVMKAERFSAVIYIEPVKEGILVYGMSGLYIPSIVSGLINVAMGIETRLTVLINWLTDSLRRQ